jgi:Domain of unknown function (DUF1707)/Cell wall-active antibiotics response 4TMS YvqF
VSDGLPSAPGDPPRPALRASDADRERVVELLRGAGGDGRLDVDELDERVSAVYASRTVAALEALTADLLPTAPEAHPAAAPGGVVVRPGPGGTSSVISIMGGAERKGRWRVAPRCLVLNIMGGSELDLNDAELSDPETTIRVISIMGGSEIRVPDGVDVHVSKLGIMGGHDVQLSPDPPPPGAPVIHIKMLAIMGGGEVKQGRKKPRRARRQLDR